LSDAPIQFSEITYGVGEVCGSKSCEDLIREPGRLVSVREACLLKKIIGKGMGNNSRETASP